MTVSYLDIIVIIIYFLVILYIGFVLSKKKEVSSDNEFLLAGRKLTLPIFVATLVATWYGSILGIGEFVYKSGFVAWVCFGLPYYIAAIIFGIFIAGKIRTLGFKSIPEQIEYFYGKTASRISSFIILVITIPAAYLLMLGIMLQLFTGWELWISIIVGALLSLIYLFFGGFRADVYTNVAQFILMYLGFGILIYFATIKYGFVSEWIGKLPEKHLKFLGDLDWQYVLAWYIIAFQTLVDPTFHQRCAAAKNPKIARKGIFVSVIFWIIFDTLTLIAGLFATGFIVTDNPLMAFPLLGENVLPAFWKGIFIVSLLATIMSTLDSYAFISGFTIGNELKKLKFFTKDFFNEKKTTQIGLLISSILGVSIAILIPSAVEIIYKTSTIAIPGLIFPLIFTYFKKIPIKSNDTIWIMIIGAISSLIFTLAKEHNVFFFKNIEPMFPAIIISGIISLIFIIRAKK